jgi:hypothetical protein
MKIRFFFTKRTLKHLKFIIGITLSTCLFGLPVKAFKRDVKFTYPKETEEENKKEMLAFLERVKTLNPKFYNALIKRFPYLKENKVSEDDSNKIKPKRLVE